MSMAVCLCDEFTSITKQLPWHSTHHMGWPFIWTLLLSVLAHWLQLLQLVLRYFECLIVQWPLKDCSSVCRFQQAISVAGTAGSGCKWVAVVTLSWCTCVLGPCPASACRSASSDYRCDRSCVTKWLTETVSMSGTTNDELNACLQLPYPLFLYCFIVVL